LQEAEAEPVAGSVANGSGPVPLAKPPVRKLARDLGVDLRLVTPAGADGVITREDVRAHAAGAVEQAAEPVVRSTNGTRREPIRGVRKATAAAMVASAFTAPHVTEFLAVDVTETMALRERLRASREYAGVKLTPLAFVAKAVCLALARTPEVNARWDEAAGEIVFHDRVQLGIAAATPRGLMVPKVRDADALTLKELAVALAALTDTARAGGHRPRTSSAARSPSPTWACSASTPAPRSSTRARRGSWPSARSSRRPGSSTGSWPCARCASWRCRSTTGSSTASRARGSSPTSARCSPTRGSP
jgi:pyruvate dehydrogenase E2 component (dihydrolipoamide acetyltransferase)